MKRIRCWLFHRMDWVVQRELINWHARDRDLPCLWHEYVVCSRSGCAKVWGRP